MLDPTLLTIAPDDQFLRLLQRYLRDREAGECRMIVAATEEKACFLIDGRRPPRLIVVDWTRGARYEALNLLLWTTTVLEHRVPVMIVSDSYRIPQATRLFRMGVAEYISRTHHEDQIGRILDTYLSGSPIPVAVAAASGDRHRRPSVARLRSSLAV
jgi:DNA-binding NarL/FixJ family response regulator